MLRIGFSKKYFTLWDVIETTEFEQVEGVNLPFKLISFNYIQNLSMDEEQAKRKAIFKNVENFEIDFDLYGRNASFSKRQELFSKIPSNKSFFFEFGKHKGKQISLIDVDYLFWYYQETLNVNAKAILLKNGFVELNGQVVHYEHAQKISLRELVINEIEGKTELEVEVLSNIDFSSKRFRFAIKDEVFEGVYTDEIKTLEYKGFFYGMPLVKGKAKRIKNKKAKINIVKKRDGKFDAGVYEINQIEILK